MEQKKTRSPIVAVLGHVDHGKTSILDCFRNSQVAKKEAGKITQMIGASYLSKQTISDLSENQISVQNIQVPGLLFIDTPGHAAFTSLRERGGSIADIAILVVDINQGFQPQTIESIKILKEFKTPFLIAANKVDLINSWVQKKTLSIKKSLEEQPEFVRTVLDTKVYELIGKLAEFGIEGERFDRITDFAKQVCVIPVSAKTKEGISEILLYLIGLSQKYMGQKIKIHADGPGKASIIEVKEEKGMGTTIDVILYDGKLKKNDEILFSTFDGVKQTNIRGLFVPKVSSNNPKEKYQQVEEIYASSGVKIMAPGLENAISGTNLIVINQNDDIEKVKAEMSKQIREILFDTNKEGVVIKADSLGSLEAMLTLLHNENIPVRSAGIGNITKKDVLNSVQQKWEYSVILGFNIKVLEEAQQEAEKNMVKIINENIIYTIIEKYEEWVKNQKEMLKQQNMKTLVWPAKIQVLPGCCFRKSKPAIFGVEVLVGKISPKIQLMTEEGEIIGDIKTIQKDKESVKIAKQGDQVAISSMSIIFGKGFNEGSILYPYIDKENRERIKKQIYEELSENEKQVFDKIDQLLSKKI